MIRRVEHKYYFIYKTICLINGKIYVGQHSTDDLDDGYIGHAINEQKDACEDVLLHRAVRKYGYENFQREIIELCDSFDQLDEREKFWIKELNSYHLLNKGYNMTKGGGGGDTISNHPRRDGIRKKNGDRHRGKKQSEEHRKNRSISMIGKNKGKTRSKETVEKWKKTYSEREPLVCSHCNYQSKNIANIKRNHFDNCKHKIFQIGDSVIWEVGREGRPIILKALYLEKISNIESRVKCYEQNGIRRNIELQVHTNLLRRDDRRD